MGPAHKGPGGPTREGPTRAQGGPQEPGPQRPSPQGPRDAHKGPAHKDPGWPIRAPTDKPFMANPLNQVIFPEHELNGTWPYIYIYETFA